MSKTISQRDLNTGIRTALKVSPVLALMLAVLGITGVSASTSAFNTMIARNSAAEEPAVPWIAPGQSGALDVQAGQAIIIDHSSTDITAVPQAWIEEAKQELHIAYGRTSHGGQLTSGMAALVDFANNGGLGLELPQDIFAWNSGGTNGALDLRQPFVGDAGYYPQWVNETTTYLGPPDPATGRGTNNPEINVVIWAWCGQVSVYSEQQMLDWYLLPMTQLEEDYPGITFVYMTGHADGTGEEGDLHLRNQQIRNYCLQNGKVLYDFYDIELYDPDGTYYGDKAVTDNCDYDSDGNGTLDSNWAIDWQNLHVEGTDWYNCSCAHSQALNCNQKAYAAWSLWAQLAVPDTTDPTVTVTSPNGGESWEAGTSQDITWSATDDVGVSYVALEYSVNGGSTWTSIDSSEPNDGTYSWLVPNDPTSSARVRVIAYDAAGNDGSDISDADFAITSPPDITDPTVTVTSPNGGESWEAGTSHDITWSATDDVGVSYVALEYSVNGGSTWTSIDPSEPNDGTYSWLVPNDPTGTARVRVIAYDAAGNDGDDISDADFAITSPPDTTDPTVTATSPNGGESWQAGTSQNITWSATDNVGVSYVALEYSVNGGSTWTSIDSSEPNDGTYSWLVPNDPTSSARVRVTAYDAAGNDGDDISDADFAITLPPDTTDPTVTVTSPNGGESWQAGTSHDITWSATDDVGVSYVALEYSVNGGSTWTSIDSSEPNDGTYSWLVPNDPTSSARVRVVAYDAAGNDGSDTSDADFAITPPATGGDAYEPDDTWDLANTISDSSPQPHSIVPVGDVDWVTFTLDAESEVLLETSGASGDTRMWLYDNGLSELEYDDNGGTDLFSRIDRLCDVDALPAGTYYVKIDEFGNNDEIPSYDIALTVVQACPGDVGPLEYDSHIVDDDTYNESFGDGDGVAECGESIELWVDLINQGTEAATGVNATISTGDPYVTWLHNTSSLYPDLSGGGTGTNTDDYDFAVGAGAPDGHIIQFDLDITASEGGPWADSFNVPVSCNHPPDTPSDPMPADGATGVSVTIDLSWTGGDPDAGDAVTYDVYLGTADPPPALLCDNAASPSCDPGTLFYNTLYYWYVVATDNHGDSTSGPVWDFTTAGGDAYEPDDTWDLANTISDGLLQTHSIVPVGDVDWATFTLDAESEVVLETSGASGDTRMWLYDNGLTELEYDDNGGTDLFSRIDRLCDVDALPAGTYYVKIDEYGNNDEIPSYDIALTVVQACPGDVGPLEYDSHLIDDDTYNESFGDGDGIVECGESIELWVDMINQGTEAATGVNATISTSDPYVTWLHNTSSLYPDLSGGGTGTNTDDYDFAVGEGAPDGHIIQFDLDITASEGGPWADSFNVPVSCNDPPYEPGDPTPADGAVDQDFDVDLSWTGGDPDGDPVTYDVYLGTTDPPADLVCSGISASVCDPGTLGESQDYFWSVVANDGGLQATSPIWQFTIVSVPPAGPTSVTEIHGVADDTWQSTVGDPAFTWSGASDAGSGVAGYYVYWGTEPAGTSSAWQTTASYDPPAVSDPSVYYLRVRTEDNAGNTSPWLTLFTFRYDATAPTGPTTVTETHGAADDTWQSTVGDPAFTWSGASDVGSGVAGYSVYWGTDPGGASGVWQTTTSYDPSAVSSPSVYYLRVQTEDNAGNTSAWLTLFTFRYDATAPSNPTSFTSSHALDTWSDDNTVYVSWSGASDGIGSGVYGYSYVWTTSSSTLPDAVVDTTGSSATSPALADDDNVYFHIRTRDNAGNWNSSAAHYGPFKIDTLAPAGPTSVTETHGVADDTWQAAVGDPAFTWSGASDAGSGVAGYYVYWGTDPSGTSSVWQTAEAHDPSAVASPSVYYLRVQTEDDAGNTSAWQTLVTFRYDATAPSNPTIFGSSPSVDTWSGDNTVYITWSGASDGAGSGVYGYSFEWSTSSSTLPDAVADTLGNSTTSPALADDDSWYFHIRTRDNVGNWNSAAAHVGPFKIDTVAPTGPTSVIETHGVADDTWQAAVGDAAFTWSGASDTGSGVAGYHVYWGTDPGGTSSAWQTSTAYDPPAVPNPSVYYLRVQTQDEAGHTSAWLTLFTFRYDASAPTNPTLSSSSHTIGVWSNLNVIDVSWTGASDGIGSGVQGYSYVWTSLPDTLPDTSVDTTANSATSPPLPGSEGWYFHVRTGDSVGNWTPGALHLGPFRIETTPPTSSVSALPASQNAIAFPVSWSGTDPGIASGVAVYDVQYRVGSDGVWTDWLVGTASTSADFGPIKPIHLRDGTTYYFRCRAVDHAGNQEDYPGGDGDTWTTVNMVSTFVSLVLR